MLPIPIECCSRCQQMFFSKRRTEQLGRLLGKVQVLCRVIKLGLGQRQRLVVLFWPVCTTLSCISHVTRFRIRTRFHGDIWLRNRNIWAMGGQLYGRRNIRVLTWCLLLRLMPFRFVMQNQQSVTSSFPSLHTIGTPNGILFFFWFL